MEFELVFLAFDTTKNNTSAMFFMEN